MLPLVALTLLALLPGIMSANDHEIPIFGPLVYLMDWKYNDVANECRFLARWGYGAVVVSPPFEHVVNTPNRPWHERYEVVSYNLNSRSGDSLDFLMMLGRCAARNIRVIVDVVLNNLASRERGSITGSGGSKANPKKYEFPEFKKSEGHFNEECDITNYKDPKNVRNCQVAKLIDVKEDHPFVRVKQLERLNMILGSYGIGFLVDKAKFMWPWELGVRMARMRDVALAYNKRPVMLFNVEDVGNGEGVTYNEYTDMGRVMDYKYGGEVAKWFTSKANFIDIIKREKLFPNWISSDDAVVFLTNVYTHTNDRRTDLLRYNENPDLFKMATIFMLAYDHGLPLVMSTYKMSKPYNDAGPPANSDGTLFSPGTECKGGWNCEHRLPEISRMAFFNRDCLGQPVKNQFGGNSPGQFAFSRGNRGFIAFNLEDSKWSQTFQTDLAEGEYCDIMTGGFIPGGYCQKDAVKVKVDNKGSLLLEVPPKSVRAIHVWSKQGYRVTREDQDRITYEELGFFQSLFNWFSTSGMVEVIPQAAPWAGEPGKSGQAGPSQSNMPEVGSVHTRPGDVH